MSVAPIAPRLTDAEKLRRLPWAFAHIATNAVFCQLTVFGSVFILFLSELGLDKAQIGLLLAFFPLAGVVAPLVAPLVARLGYKRVFVALWATRKVVVAGLLLTPLIAVRYGPTGTLRFVAADIAAFALCRAIAETGMYPWMREFVPDQVRGRFAAIDNILNTFFGFLAISFAGYVIGRRPGLDGYMVLIGIGVLFGFLAVIAIAFVPGGAPQRATGSVKPDLRATWTTLGDHRFLRFLIGLGLVTLAVVPLNSFLALFARERLGLAQANVVFLQGGALIGGLLLSYVWGWAADRFGSRPVMLLGAGAAALLPLLWLAVPARASWTFEAAIAAAFVTGAAQPAWSIGSSRFLFMDVVPRHSTPQYMATFYAWIGITGAFSAILSGRVLQTLQALPVQLAGRSLDPYAMLFLFSVLMALVAVQVLATDRKRING
ncbi:MAG: MFS transporter [Anaerolineae bacterium]